MWPGDILAGISVHGFPVASRDGPRYRGKHHSSFPTPSHQPTLGVGDQDGSVKSPSYALPHITVSGPVPVSAVSRHRRDSN